MNDWHLRTGETQRNCFQAVEWERLSYRVGETIKIIDGAIIARNGTETSLRRKWKLWRRREKEAKTIQATDALEKETKKSAKINVGGVTKERGGARGYGRAV